MLYPKQTKFRKYFKGRNNRGNSNTDNILFGSFAIKSLEYSNIKSIQIESARKAINNYIKRNGKIWIRIFPDIPITKKPIEVRMGKGKGNLDHWVAKVKPGKVIFELECLNRKIAFDALKIASSKLPVKTGFMELD